MAHVSLPRILEPVVGDDLRFEVEAQTLAEVLEGIFDRHPGLRVHLFDESGAMRPHVLCFVDANATRLDTLSIPITTTTEVAFIQAVSGG